MALIKCPECGHMISEFASHCISCGCPMTKIKEILNTNTFEYEYKKDRFISKLIKVEKEFVTKVIEKVHDYYSVVEHKQYIMFNSNSQDYLTFWFKRPSTGLKIGYKDSNNKKHTHVIASLDPYYVLKRVVLEKPTASTDTSSPKTTEADKKKQNKESNNIIDRLSVNEITFVNNFLKSLSKKYPSEYIISETKSYIGIKTKQSKTYDYTFVKPDHYLVFRFLYLKKDILIKNTTEASLLKAVDDDRNGIIHVNEEDKKPSRHLKETTLYEDLTSKEKTYVDEFKQFLFANYDCFTESDARYMYKFKHPSFEHNCFWFTKPDKKLFYNRWDALAVGVNKRTLSVTNNDIKKIIEDAKVFLKMLGITPRATKKLFPINELIIKALKGQKIDSKEKYKELAEEVAKYTSDYIFDKYKALKKFNTREEFDRYKNKYNDYVYHGRAFSFKYPTEKDAAFFFEYYIASRLISVIQKYEKAYGQIIVDYKQLLYSYYDLIHEQKDSYQSVNGINSNIKYVPFETLEEEVKKYYY